MGVVVVLGCGDVPVWCCCCTLVTTDVPIEEDTVATEAAEEGAVEVEVEIEIEDGADGGVEAEGTEYTRLVVR